jgi:hypothetical protein
LLRDVKLARIDDLPRDQAVALTEAQSGLDIDDLSGAAQLASQGKNPKARNLLLQVGNRVAAARRASNRTNPAIGGQSQGYCCRQER